MRKVNRKLWLALYTAASCVSVVIMLAAQVTIVGLLDRFGFSPQYSFLALNLLLIATITLSLAPRNFVTRAQAWRSAVGDRPTLTSRQATTTALISKILIMRRVSLSQLESSVDKPKEGTGEISTAVTAG